MLIVTVGGGNKSHEYGRAVLIITVGENKGVLCQQDYVLIVTLVRARRAMGVIVNNTSVLQHHTNLDCYLHVQEFK